MKYDIEKLAEVLDKMTGYIDPKTNIIALTSAEVCVIAGLEEFDADLIDCLVNLVLDNTPILLQVHHALMDFFMMNPAIMPITDGEPIAAFAHLFSINQYKDKETE